jgi:hypothetical protein
MICCPGDGVGSKAPYGVTTTPGSDRSVANAGRSLKKVSPFVSRPVVMLKGGPELATAKKVQADTERYCVVAAEVHETQRVEVRAREFVAEIVSI